MAGALPEGEGWLFEPKWDGFRALVFRDGGEWLLQSRDKKPMNRYFPELGFKPLRVDGEHGLVAEVAYDHMQGDRFRHPAQFRRWRPDKPPAACRHDQLEVTPPYELGQIFAGAGAALTPPPATGGRSRPR